MEYQRTIRESLELPGVNIYNGRGNSVKFYPAPVDSGLVFRVHGMEIPASLVYARKHRHAIWLSDGKSKVGLVEHLLSAVYSLGIDNLVISLSDSVCPTTPNCAQEYFLGLRKLVKSQDAPKRYFRVANPCETNEVRSDDGKISIAVSSSPGFVVDYKVDFPHRCIGKQRLEFQVSPENYEEEIMDCRSPSLLHCRPLASLVLTTGRLGFHGVNDRDYLIVGSKGSKRYLNPKMYGVRHEGNEVVRHKILDFLGTLALTGRQFKDTRFDVSCSGHEFDIFALSKMFEEGVFVG
jgi:UDP-3-O-[3-hydroxymyristoyl] N-acetylglucosamine deacetylase